MILEQLILGLAVAALVLLLPFLLVMAGIGAAMLLWFVASAAVLGALVFWLVFPDIYGTAILLLALVIGLLLVDRCYRSRQGAILIGGRTSGRTIGIVSNNPTNAHCAVSEPSVVHRRVPETTRPRDSTRLPSNIRHLQPSDRCASARNASTSIDTAAPRMFPPRTSNLEPSTMNHP